MLERLVLNQPGAAGICADTATDRIQHQGQVFPILVSVPFVADLDAQPHAGFIRQIFVRRQIGDLKNKTVQPEFISGYTDHILAAGAAADIPHGICPMIQCAAIRTDFLIQHRWPGPPVVRTEPYTVVICGRINLDIACHIRRNHLVIGGDCLFQFFGVFHLCFLGYAQPGKTILQLLL